MIRKDNEPKTVTYGEVAKNLNDGLENFDPARLAGLQQLQRVRAAKSTSLQREQARLTEKYGANHARVTTVVAKAEANRLLQRDLSYGIERAQTPPVQADPKAWTLHGHVRDSSRKGIDNLTVALYDDKGQWIEELGHACTDAHGYFRLTVKPEGSPDKQEAVDTKQGAEVKDAQETLARAAREKDAAASRRAAYTRVTNNQKVTLYIDREPTVPKLGEVIYREIIIDGDSCECAPPDGKPTKGERKGGKGKNEEPKGRYLGNRAKQELHDLNNTKPGCQVDEIKQNQRQYFASQREGVSAGYDLCAYCFGKESSKR